MCLTFDDGHDTGIYAWTTLHDLGVNYEKNWAAYLEKLEAYGLNRGDKTGLFTEVKSITLLYFMTLADVSGTHEDKLTLPTSVINVATLLAWLRGKGDAWKDAFADDQVQVTINKEFVKLHTVIDSGDEIALVPLDTEQG